MKHFITENERRANSNRRRFCYAAYVPERRSGSERRSISEKWSSAEKWSGIEKNFGMAVSEAKTTHATIKAM